MPIKALKIKLSKNKILGILAVIPIFAMAIVSLSSAQFNNASQDESGGSTVAALSNDIAIEADLEEASADENTEETDEVTEDPETKTDEASTTEEDSDDNTSEEEQNEAQQQQQAPVPAPEQVAIAAVPVVEPAPAPEPVAPASEGAGQSLNFVNNVRAEVGKLALATDGVVTAWASAHAARMASQCNLYHQSLRPFLGNSVSSGTVNAIGENIAYNSTLDRALMTLRNSPVHYGNMTGDFTHAGFGTARASGGSCSGTLYTVQIYIRN